MVGATHSGDEGDFDERHLVQSNQSRKEMSRDRMEAVVGEFLIAEEDD